MSRIKAYLLLLTTLLILGAVAYYFGPKLFIMLSVQFFTLAVVGGAYYDIKRNVISAHENNMANQKKLMKEIRSLK